VELLDAETEVRDYALERQMMLSDGVFAIALTLLALELRPGEAWDHTLAGLWREMGPGLFAYVWSFLSIAATWAAHRQSYGRFRRADFGLSALGLALLGLVTLIPLATRLFIEAPTVAVTWLYVGLFALVAFFSAASWVYAAWRPGLLDPRVGPRTRAVVAAILLTVSPLMTGLGVFSGREGWHWLCLLMAPVIALATWARRWAPRADARAGHAPRRLGAQGLGS
jgi:uncharacterized membrane protein